MKKQSKKSSAIDAELEIPETQPEFFNNATAGKYYKDYVHRHGRKPVTAVTLEEDVAAVFKDSESVNKVLRALNTSFPSAKARSRRRSA